MARGRGATPLILLCLLIGPTLGGCAEAEKGTTEFSADPPAGPGSSGPSSRFRVPGGDNSTQEFGVEAGGAELRQAAAAFQGFLDSQLRREWGAACRYLASSTRQSLAELAGEEGCGAGLAKLVGPTKTSRLREAAVVEVGALRVDGRTGFLLYRGVDGAGYAIAVRREAGGWKVASPSGVPLL